MEHHPGRYLRWDKVLERISWRTAGQSKGENENWRQREREKRIDVGRYWWTKVAQSWNAQGMPSSLSLSLSQLIPGTAGIESSNVNRRWQIHKLFTSRYHGTCTTRASIRLPNRKLMSNRNEKRHARFDIGCLRCERRNGITRDFANNDYRIRNIARGANNSLIFKLSFAFCTAQLARYKFVVSWLHRLVLSQIISIIKVN